MEEEKKPIKRSEQLAPLSREHHEGLLFAWKIRQGLKNGTSQETIARFADWFWQNHFQEHFREEEQYLASKLPADNELVKRMLEEHQEIEALIHINEQIADPSLLEKLADLVNDHIRFEERELFPFAEQILGQNELNEIHNHLNDTRHQINTWKDEFWLKK